MKKKFNKKFNKKKIYNKEKMLLLELFTLLVALTALAISIYLWVDKKKNGLHPNIAKALNDIDDNQEGLRAMCQNDSNPICAFLKPKN